MKNAHRDPASAVPVTAGAPPAGRLPHLLGGVAAAALAGLLLLGATASVYMTGGTGYAMTHSLYIPVILAGSLLGIPGGVLTGIAAGLLLGPYMPLDVASGEMQQTANWMVRLSFLATAGFLTGWILRLVRRQQEQVRQSGLLSTGTKLPNRQALIDTLQAIGASPDLRGRYTLALVRINNFDQIINGLGTELGEQLVRALAERLLELVPRAGRVYDLRANKLALLLPEAASGIEAYMRRTNHIPDEPISVDGIPIFIDLSVGTASLDAATGSPEPVLQRANIAASEAAHGGRFHVAYQPEGEAGRRRNQELLAQLPRAIRGSELFLEYQPKIDLRSNRSNSVEALVRWQHPQLGRIAPIDFIGPAEGTGLVHPLTRWVFRTAIREIAALRAGGHDLGVAINLSPRNLGDPELFAYLLSILREHRLPADRVELEITESAILHGSTRIRDSLEELRRQGIRISIDDFGTGYTSLRHLADLPIDCLKIDRSFVGVLLSDSRSRSIVRGIVNLARDLGMSTVAEGVEDLQTAEALAEMGCDVGQGFVFCRPISPNKLDVWLKQSEQVLGVD